MNKALATALAVLALTAASPARAGELEFSYAPLGPEGYWGTAKAENYIVALDLTNPVFAGKTISHLSIPMPVCEKVADLSAWVSTSLELTLVDGVNTLIPDLADVALEPPTEGNEDGWTWLQVDLAEPVTIPATGAYAGYMFKITGIGTVAQAQAPVIIGRSSQAGAMWVRTSRTYRGWTDIAAREGYCTAMQVTLDGDFMLTAAQPSDISDYYGLTNAPGSVQATVTNLGTEAITSLAYTASVGSQTLDGTLDLADTPITNLTQPAQLTFSLPAYPAEGEVNVAIEITAVNGQPNQAAEARTERTAAVADAWYFSRPLMEEYTGTTCGYCPRGMVAMEYMAENYGLDFCGVAWHTYDKKNDPMYPAAPHPSQVSSFPGMYINRTTLVDPYYGFSKTGFGLEDAWLQYHKVLSPFVIEVEAAFDPADATRINCSATVDVVGEVDAADTYRVEFLLVGDDLHGNYDEADPAALETILKTWGQTNNYNSSSYAGMYLMAPFVGAGNPVKRLHYNEVGLLTSGLGGIDGSVSSLAVGSRSEASFTFDVSNVLNGDGQLIPFKPNKLKVIAVVLRKSGTLGVAVDSRMCQVDGAQGALTVARSAATEVVETRWFDISGRQAATAPQKGLWIRVDRMADGTLHTSKTIL